MSSMGARITIVLSLRDDGMIAARPSAFLGDRFNDYRQACDAAGSVYEKDTKSQKAPTSAHGRLVASLESSGFFVETEESLATALALQAQETKAQTDASDRRIAEIERVSGQKFRPFQVTGIRWLLSRKTGLLGDDMGLGKTVQVCGAIPENSPVIVLCPAVAKGVWQRELAKWRSDIRVTTLEGKDSFRWPVNGEAVILNYEIMPMSPEELLEECAYVSALCHVSNRGKRGKCSTVQAFARQSIPIFGESFCVNGYTPRGDVDLEYINGMAKGTIVVADEFHRAKNPKSTTGIRAKAMMLVARESGGRSWGLTATPLLNKAPELWALLECLGCAEEAFGKWLSFAAIMGGVKGKFAWEWAATPTPESFARIRRVSLRRTKKEVLKDLPPKTRETLVVPFVDKTGAGAEIVRALAATGIDLESIDLDALKKKITFELIAKISSAMSAAKAPFAMQLVEDHEEASEPLVVFSSHRAIVDALGRREGWAAITGSTASGSCDQPECRKHRECIAKAFQAGELSGIAGTIDAAGTAITLTRAARVLFVDREWTPELNTQAEDRCYRIGQTRPVIVTVLVADHPIERRLHLLLEQKTRIIEASVGASSVGASRGNVRGPQSQDEANAATWLYSAGSGDWLFSVLSSEINGSGGLLDRQWKAAVWAMKRHRK